MALLIWLLKGDHQPRPVGDLYRATRISEPTMRQCVRAFVDRGLATIERDRVDSRRRFIRTTAKFRRKVNAYKAQLAELGGTP